MMAANNGVYLACYLCASLLLAETPIAFLLFHGTCEELWTFTILSFLFCGSQFVFLFIDLVLWNITALRAFMRGRCLVLYLYRIFYIGNILGCATLSCMPIFFYPTKFDCDPLSAVLSSYVLSAHFVYLASVVVLTSKRASGSDQVYVSG